MELSIEKVFLYWVIYEYYGDRDEIKQNELSTLIEKEIKEHEGEVDIKREDLINGGKLSTSAQEYLDDLEQMRCIERFKKKNDTYIKPLERCKVSWS